MTKGVLISGCNGYMGKIVTRLIRESDDFHVKYGLDKPDTVRMYKGFPIFNNMGYLCDGETPPDIIIDFSAPKATMNLLDYAKSVKVPMVIATTGFTEEQEEEIKAAAKLIPIFKSANMEANISLIKKVLQIITPYLSDYEVEVLETHHNRKKDAPSGTALLLANAIKDALAHTDDKEIIYGRTGKRKENEIGIASMRGGNVTGEHSVFFFGNSDTIEIKHTAHSREGFAVGALKAARFLLNQTSPGLYSMDDMLQL